MLETLRWEYDTAKGLFVARDPNDGHLHNVLPEHVFGADLFDFVGLSRKLAHKLWRPGYDPRLLIRGGSGNLYAVTGGAAAAVGAVKVMAQLATGSAVDAVITQFDVTMDGTNAAATPVAVDIASETGASSVSGSAYTPNKYGNPAGRAAQATARINDTTDGASPTVLKTYYVPPTSGLIIQSPLDREKGTGVSSFTAFRINAPAAVNYKCNVEFAEGG